MAKAKKLPSGSWRVQASVTVGGIKTVKSFTNKDRKKAELLAAQWRAEFLSYNETDRITLQTAYARYIDSKRNVLSPSTIREYERQSKIDFPELMPVLIESITQERIQRAVDKMARTHSAKSVKNSHGLLSAVLRVFRPDLRLITSLPQKTKHAVYIPDDDDIRTLLEASDGVLRRAILLAAFGPMRRGEICALEDADIKGNTVAVNKNLVQNSKKDWVIKAPKTYSGYRTIDFPDFVIEEIKKEQGRIVPITPNALTSRFARRLKKLDIPHFRFHDLRHYCVSIQKAIGVPDIYIMERGGWSSTNTMNAIYAHVLKKNRTEQELRTVEHFNKMSDIIKNNSHENSHEIKKMA